MSYDPLRFSLCCIDLFLIGQSVQWAVLDKNGEVDFGRFWKRMPKVVLVVGVVMWVAPQKICDFRSIQ